MTRSAWTVVVLAVTAVMVAATLTGLPRPLALAQMPMQPGRPMSGPQHMPSHMSQMTATVQAMRAQFNRINPALLTSSEQAMYEYLKLLQAHFESMAGGMRMPGGMMPPGGVSGQPGGTGGVSAPATAAPQTVPGARVVTITAVEFAFRPSTIQARAGTDLNLVVVNRGVIEHDLEVGGLDFHLHTNPRQQTAGGLRNLKAGTYEFYCTIAGHKEAGMRGRLVVTP
jgi:uncharacterized cupredoxin-like copper-binding protein